MAVVPPKETVFNTGPSDSMTVVDVYGDAVIASSATPTELGGDGLGANSGNPYSGLKDDPYVKELQEELDARKAKEAAAAVANIKPETKVGDIVEAGASGDQIKSKMDQQPPKDVDIVEVFTDFKDRTFKELNDATSIINGNIGLDDDGNLMISADFKTFTDGILNFIDKMGLSGLLCPGEKYTGAHIRDAIKQAKNIINIRKHIGCNKGKPEMDFGFEANISQPIAMRSALDAASKYGAYDVANDIINDYGKPNSPAASDRLIDGMMGNYKKRDGETAEDSKREAQGFTGLMNNLNSTWNKYTRNGEEVQDSTKMSKASPDAKEKFRQNEDTEVDAIISDNVSLKNEKVQNLIRNKYPNFRLDRLAV